MPASQVTRLAIHGAAGRMGQRLVALAMRLETARATGDSLRAILDEAAVEIRAAVEDVRALSGRTAPFTDVDPTQAAR